jgi:FtsH-binding integral membrane protein
MYQARERRVEIIRRRLLRRSRPRFHVTLILLSTGLAGFLTSFSLLHLGLLGMGLRYPLAILFAYGMFLLLLWLWLWLQRRDRKVDIDPSVLDFIPQPAGNAEIFEIGSGGDFSGGGAGGSWGASVSTSAQTPAGGSSAEGVGSALDLEYVGLIVVAAVAVLGGLIASFYIIYIAPTLLAEILVDGALVAGLYRRVKRIERKNWLHTAIRRTLLPVILVTIFFTVAGFALQQAVPNAHTMGDVWTYVRGR